MIVSDATQNRTLPKSVVYLALVAVTVSIGAATAADLCTDMNFLVRQANSNFSDSSTEAADAVALPGADSCAVTPSLSGVRVYHCAWSFAYRASIASFAFDAFNHALHECFGDRAKISKDRSVNHPDFYDLREYLLDQVKVTVSIKDKSESGKTYVFVRVHGGNPD